MCVGIPGQVLGVYDAEQQLVNVNISGMQRPVNAACVLEAGERIQDLAGSWVLVHVGFALSRLDEQEARETLALLAELEADWETGLKTGLEPDLEPDLEVQAKYKQKPTSNDSIK